MSLYDKLSLIAQYLIFFATLIYAWIAHRQLSAIDLSAKAAELSAMAVLQHDRPLMIVTAVEPDGFEPQPNSTVRKVLAKFQFTNQGKGIAIITDVRARLAFRDEFDVNEQLEGLFFSRSRLVSAGETTHKFAIPFVYRLVIDEARWHLMDQMAKQLELRGRVDYTDLAHQKRWTTFTFVYSTIRHDFYSSDAEYDMYTDSRYSDHYDEQAQGYFARLWAALLGREAPVTHR